MGGFFPARAYYIYFVFLTNAWEDFFQQEENEGALRKLRDLNNSSGGAPTVSLIGMSLSGAFSEGTTDFLTRLANIKFPTPISHGTLSHLPARSRWMDWNMRIIQRNMLEIIGEAVTSGIRLWKATAPTALHSDYAPERPERRSRMWAAGSRGSGSSELGIPSEISIYSDHGGDHFEPNIRSGVDNTTISANLTTSNSTNAKEFKRV